MKKIKATDITVALIFLSDLKIKYTQGLVLGFGKFF